VTELLINAFYQALEAAMPATIVPAHLPPWPRGRLVVVGAGKAAASMAVAVEDHYQRPLEGLVITRYGHGLPTRFIEVVEAAHPVPDETGLRATQRILELAQGLSEDDVLLCLLSGGGSALLVAPSGLTLEQKASLTRALLKSGADIREMNAVRKHLSAIKGGRLARAAFPAQVESLIISDVTGDDLGTIASGPTAPDPYTFQDALDILSRYEIAAPEARAVFQKGLAGSIAETPKASDPLFQTVKNTIIANAQAVLETCAAFFRKQGITPLILSESLTGEAREAAKFHAALARQIISHQQPVPRPCVLISGGETTVTVRGKGRGGRNSEFLLSLALELDGVPGLYALAADTDGIDGSEDNAGALLSPESLKGLNKREARGYLENNDAYNFFASRQALLKTGPTRTNVNDLRILLII
jgi:hydroxypyruvate reductase